MTITEGDIEEEKSTGMKKMYWRGGIEEEVAVEAEVEVGVVIDIAESAQALVTHKKSVND